MLRRFRRHLSPPMVVATIALFVALGGGYATAFSGSGTLQKGNVTGLTNSYTTVRTLTGIGSIQARCPSDGNGILRFHNASGKSLVVDQTLSHQGDGLTALSTGVANNTDYDLNVPASNDDWFYDWHIQPALGEPAGSKSPQASAQVSFFVSNCAGSRVAALALNTQQ